jgi:hypothetical protein
MRLAGNQIGMTFYFHPGKMNTFFAFSGRWQGRLPLFFVYGSPSAKRKLITITDLR